MYGLKSLKDRVIGLTSNSCSFPPPLSSTLFSLSSSSSLLLFSHSKPVTGPPLSANTRERCDENRKDVNHRKCRINQLLHAPLPRLLPVPLPPLRTKDLEDFEPVNYLYQLVSYLYQPQLKFHPIRFHREPPRVRRFLRLPRLDWV